MFKRALLASACLWCLPVQAQNVLCPTRPAGDSSNACASTAFVNAGGLSPVSPAGAPFTATPNYGASDTQNLFLGILGTSGSPNAIADAPFIWQKWSVGTTGVNVQNPTGYFATWKTGNASNAHATALYAESVDNGGWNNAGSVSYVEGIRSTAVVNGSLGSAYGVVCSAGDNTSVTYTFLISCEANPANNSGVDAPTTLNSAHLILGYNAALFGTNKADAGYYTTALGGAVTFRVGYICGAGSIDQACFRSLASSVYGIDLAQGTYSTAAINATGFSVSPAGLITSGAVSGSSGSVTLNGSTSGNNVVSVSAAGGHFNTVASATPSLTAGCNGAGSSISGSDTKGVVTGQTAAATTCTLQFGSFFAAAPTCVATGLSSPLTGAVTVNTNGIAVNFASTANFQWSYMCFGA